MEMLTLLKEFIEETKLVYWTADQEVQELQQKQKDYNGYKNASYSLYKGENEHNSHIFEELYDYFKRIPTQEELQELYKKQLDNNDIEKHKHITNIYKIRASKGTKVKNTIAFILNSNKSHRVNIIDKLDKQGNKILNKDDEPIKEVQEIYYNSIKFVGLKKYNQNDKIKYNILYRLLVFLEKRGYKPKLKHIDIAKDILVHKDDFYISAPYDKNHRLYSSYIELQEIYKLYKSINKDIKFNVLHNKNYIREMALKSNIVLLEKTDLLNKLEVFESYRIEIHKQYKELIQKVRKSHIEPKVFIESLEQEFIQEENKIPNIKKSEFLYYKLGLEHKEIKEIREIFSSKYLESHINFKRYELIIFIIQEYSKEKLEELYNQPLLSIKLQELIGNSLILLLKEKANNLKYKTSVQKSYYYNKSKKENLPHKDNYIMRFEVQLKIDDKLDIKEQISKRLSKYRIITIDKEDYKSINNRYLNYRLEILKNKHIGSSHSKIIPPRKKVKTKNNTLTLNQHRYGNILYQEDFSLLKEHNIKYKLHSINLSEIDYILDMFIKPKYTSTEDLELLEEFGLDKAQEILLKQEQKDKNILKAIELNNKYWLNSEKEAENTKTQESEKESEKQKTGIYLKPKTYLPLKVHRQDLTIKRILEHYNIKDNQIFKIEIEDIINLLKDYSKLKNRKYSIETINKHIERLKRSYLMTLKERSKKSKVQKLKRVRRKEYEIQHYKFKAVIKLRLHNITFQKKMYDCINLLKDFYIEHEDKSIAQYESINTFIIDNYNSSYSADEILHQIYEPLEELYDTITIHENMNKYFKKEEIMTQVEIDKQNLESLKSITLR